MQRLEVNSILLFLQRWGNNTGFHGTQRSACEKERKQGYKHLADRAQMASWSGCLGGKCAQWHRHMFPQVFDLLVSQKTLLNDQKNTLESCDSKEKLKMGGGGEDSLSVPLSPLCH